jgi:hypothetical protein
MKANTNVQHVATTTTTDMYVKAGNIFHAFNLVNVLAYAAMVITFGKKNENDNDPTQAQNQNNNQWFDEAWLSQGFCISNPDVPFWSSHDLCLYMDTILAVAIGVIYLGLRNCRGGSTSQLQKMQQANDMMKWQAFSVLGHGLAHGAMAAKIRSLSSLGDHGQQVQEQVLQNLNVSDASQMELLQQSLGRGETGGDGDSNHNLYDPTAFLQIVGQSLLMGLVFWFPMLRSAVPRTTPHWKVLILSGLVVVGGMTAQRHHAFTYVQTVITAVFAYCELCGKTTQQKSSFVYPVFGFVGIPIGLVPWIEAMACQSSGYMKFGGHVLYDVSIPIWLIAAYLTCYFKFQAEEEEVNKNKQQAVVASSSVVGQKVKAL